MRPDLAMSGVDWTARTPASNMTSKQSASGKMGLQATSGTMTRCPSFKSCAAGGLAYVDGIEKSQEGFVKSALQEDEQLARLRTKNLNIAHVSAGALDGGIQDS